MFGLTKGPPLHDPLAVAVLLNPSFGIFGDQEERWHVDVVTDGLHSDSPEEQGQVGRTVILEVEEGGVHIPRNVNVHRFWAIVEQCMQHAAATISS